MDRILILEDSTYTAALIKLITEQDIRYVCTGNYRYIDSCIIDEPIRGHGWYNKFNKVDKRRNYKS